MTEQPPRPVRLTQQRAEALLAIFQIGANEESIRITREADLVEDAEAADRLREREHGLRRAHDAASIIRGRYGASAPTEPEQTLF